MRQSESRRRFHNLRLLSSYLRGELRCPDLPATAIVGVSNRCNLRCPMCLRAVRGFPGTQADFGTFRTVIDQGARFFRYVSLDGPGEPLLNPDLHRMVRYCRSLGIRVVYSTNCTLFSKENIQAILDSGLDHIILSVNGATAEVFEKYNLGADYNQVVRNIRLFLSMKLERRSPVLVTVQMVRLPDTIPQARLFQTQWRVPGVDSVRIKSDVVRLEHVWPGGRRKPRGPGNRCPRLWNGPLYVNYDGDVNGCPGILLRTEALGNVREKALIDLWNGKRMQEMRKAHVEGDYASVPECSVCAYPSPRLPLILGSFLVNPFLAGRLIPVFEKLAFFRKLPFYERFD
ncbi:MAG: radical SAM protein [Acidobacteria bacterium]|nr:MAG: radical SAM protein [Acidobacteriota bacterium]